MSWINTLNSRSELRDCRLQQEVTDIKFDNPGYVTFKVPGKSFSYSARSNSPIYKRLKQMYDLNSKYGSDGKILMLNDHTFKLDNSRGVFFGNGQAKNKATGKVEKYNTTTGHFASYEPGVKEEEKTEAPKTPVGGDSTRGNKPKGNIPSKTESVPPTTTHTATYTAPGGATGAFGGKGAYAWTTNEWGWNGNKKGTLNSTVASNLKLSGNATAEQAQQFLIDKGYNITKDNVWGKQSQAAYDDYMNKMIASKPASEGLNGEKNNIPLSSPMQFKEAPTKPINTDALTNPKLNLHPGDRTALTMQIRDIKPQYRQYNRSETRDWLRMKNVNPYDLNGSDRRALRNYLSGDTTGKNYDINQLKGLNTKYNWGLKFQQGGQITMNEEQQMQQAFLQYLVKQTGAKSEQELEQVIQKLGEDGLKQAYAQFVQAMQQQQVQAAKFGAKLNYIKHLRGQCPEGMQMQYYKVGGRICKKCMAMEQKGGKAEEEGDVVEQFKKGRKKKCK